jgi:hypothetical protein
MRTCNPSDYALRIGLLSIAAKHKAKFLAEGHSIRWKRASGQKKKVPTSEIRTSKSHEGHELRQDSERECPRQSFRYCCEVCPVLLHSFKRPAGLRFDLRLGFMNKQHSRCSENCTSPPGQEKARRATFEHNGGLPCCSIYAIALRRLYRLGTLCASAERASLPQ